MQSPFDSKNRLAAALDHGALLLLVLLGSLLYFLFLWRSWAPSLAAGLALFVLLALLMLLLERRTLRRRDRLLRERLGGEYYLEDLLLLPGGEACESALCLLCEAFGAEKEAALMRYEQETWLVRCAQCLPGSSTGAGDVLSAHRARRESGAQRCVLVTTAAFTAEAVRMAEWVDPPVRLMSGRQLARLAGRLHPAGDADIAERAGRRRTPFTRERIRALALAPQKTRRYLLCAALLLAVYLTTDAFSALAAMLLSFLLAMLCAAENRRRFTL